MEYIHMATEDKKRKKGFFQGLLDKLDKRLEKKSKKCGCCECK